MSTHTPDLRLQDELGGRAGPVSALTFCPRVTLWLWPSLLYHCSPTGNSPQAQRACIPKITHKESKGSPHTPSPSLRSSVPESHAQC